MRTFFLFIILISSPILIAMTYSEATGYGSDILICKDSKVVRYWSLFSEDNRSKIFDNMKRKAYSLDECELYRCSPDPVRTYRCILPNKK